jgi:hypothetical protein
VPHWLEINLMDEGTLSHLASRRGEFLTFNIGHLLILIGMIGTLVVSWNHDQTELQDHERRLLSVETAILRTHDEDDRWKQNVTEKLQQIQADLGYIRGRQGIPAQHGDLGGDRTNGG